MPLENTRLSLSLEDGSSFISRKELGNIVMPLGGRLSPLRHHVLYDMIVDHITQRTPYRIKDVFNTVSHGGNRYIGLFQIDGFYDATIDWGLAIMNYNDARVTLDMNGGAIIPAAGPACTFHKNKTILKRHERWTEEDVPPLVNETIDELLTHFNLELERMEAYKAFKLTPEVAHHHICRLLMSTIVAGRLAHELITSWEFPKNKYFGPRTLWSLFCLCSQILNRLRAPEMIQRTIELHNFFDEIAKFDKKPTKWVQSQLLA